MRAYTKTVFREYKQSFSRFAAVFAIVALGCGFLCGLMATTPDMRTSMDAYYDENEFYDLRLLSTMGFTDQDIDAVAALSGVRAAVGGYSTDAVVCAANDERSTVRFLSFSDTVDRLTVTDGRLPERAGECVLERALFSDRALAVGQTLTLPEETEGLAASSFTVVGIVESPRFCSISKESSGVGDGTVAFTVYLTDADFTYDCYTELLLTVDPVRADNTFSDPYDEHLTPIADAIDALAPERCQVRYNEIADEYDRQINAAQEAYNTGKAEYDTAKAQYDGLCAALSAGMPIPMDAQELDAMGRSLAQSENELSAAREEIVRAQSARDALAVPEWYVQHRADNKSYQSYADNVEKVAAIARVFPLFFFAVAVLVCLTTMTRMVEEQRALIGTLGSLGFSRVRIACKYLIYALSAALPGAVVGMLIGFRLFPAVIYQAYSILFRLPALHTPFLWRYALPVGAAAVLCTAAATLVAVLGTLRGQPAALLLPKAPTAGKRVFLERIPFVWRRLSFFWKVTVRNIIRYKNRFFMTVIGIAGCTALLLTGFGLRDAISDIARMQFHEILRYDAVALLTGTGADDDIMKTLDDAGAQGTFVYSSGTASVHLPGVSPDITLTCVPDADTLSELVTLRDRTSGAAITVGEDSVILTEKFARLHGVHAGDTLTVEDDGVTATLTVSAICENYVDAYLYLTDDCYARAFGSTPEHNSVFIRMDADTQEQTLAASLLAYDEVVRVQMFSDVEQSFEDLLSNIDYIVVVLILCAGILAFIVLYNLTNINVEERKRELATVKVLGFYDGEVGSYIYRETAVLTLIGAAVGLVAGVFLCRFVVGTAEVEMVMFSRQIKAASYLFSVAITLLFSLAVNAVMYRKMKKIDMVQSLKSE